MVLDAQALQAWCTQANIAGVGSFVLAAYPERDDTD